MRLSSSFVRIGEKTERVYEREENQKITSELVKQDTFVAHCPSSDTNSNSCLIAEAH